jgi:hypothetical protein
MYMREMGIVNLLEQEDEIRIAKEIESGIFEIMQAITLYPSTTEHFFKAHKRLEEGKCKITDVIIGRFQIILQLCQNAHILALHRDLYTPFLPCLHIHHHHQTHPHQMPLFSWQNPEHRFGNQ